MKTRVAVGLIITHDNPYKSHATQSSFILESAEKIPGNLSWAVRKWSYPVGQIR